MVGRELSGRELAEAICGDVSRRVAALAGTTGVVPKLAILSVAAGEASVWYVGSLARRAERVDLGCELAELGADTSAQAITDTLHGWNARADIAGIILQAPLPTGLDNAAIAAEIAPARTSTGQIRSR